MKSLILSDYIAVVSDFDDTILDNQGQILVNGLHERSRLHAIRTVGVTNNLPALVEFPAELDATAFINSHIHGPEGAFWWTLTQTKIIDSSTPFDANHPIVRQLMAVKDKAYKKLLAAKAREIPGAFNFFSYLHDNGFANRLAIASTGNRADIQTFFNSNGFNEYFSPEHIIAKENTLNPKPDPESFRKAIESMNIPLNQAYKVLAFEDDPRGIEAAKSLGMYTCAVTSRHTARALLALPQPPDYVAADFNEYISVFGINE